MLACIRKHTFLGQVLLRTIIIDENHINYIQLNLSNLNTILIFNCYTYLNKISLSSLF